MRHQIGKDSIIFIVLPENWLLGLSIAIIFAIASYLSKKIDFLGAITGGVISFCLFLGSQWLGLLTLILLFILVAIVTQWKIKEKQRLGLEQSNKGRRSSINVLSNGSTAGLCGFFAWIFPDYQSLFELMMLASIASAASDTFSSELGNVYGRRYINILSLERDQRGKDGVISLEGSLAGLVGSCMVAIIYIAFQGWSVFIIYIIVCGMIGNLIDSLLGASLQQNGVLDNHQVNLISTFSSSLWMALLLML